MADSIYPDSDGEFGYEFSAEDEAALLQLTSNNKPPREASVDPSAVIDSVPSKGDTIAAGSTNLTPLHTAVLRPRDDRPTTARVPTDPTIDLGVQANTLPSPVSPDEDVTYPDLSRLLSDLEKAQAAASKSTPDAPPPPKSLISVPWDTFDDDGRSPLQRFRSYPRRPLAVTDLTAGAWCELQYWYTLTRLPGGRRTKTPAMRQGSKVHQKLEDEVHTTVKVEIMTKEDGFALKLWNLVQGLRTLRDTGLTRELQVWGIIDGNLVNGVIDSVSYDNPNPEFEEELSSQESQINRQQSRVTDYYPSKESGTKGNKRPKIYLADVKTRGSLVPISKALLRPAKIQLLLYYRFLGEMAADRLDYHKIFRRYGLDADDTFSDGFMAQMGSLHDDIFVDAPMSSDPEPLSSGQSIDGGLGGPTSSDLEDGASEGPDLLKYKTLRELVSLVQQEIRLTFPEGENSLGHMLRVQYVHRQDGREIDVHDFPVSKQALETYLGRYMPWWRGEREAHGVTIEEAFKCRTCEFAADCTWRQEMDDERVRKAQQKVRAKAKQAANGP